MKSEQLTAISDQEKEEIRPTCGLVMPISAIEGLTSDHWIEVKNIVSEAILAAGFHPNLVSDGDDSSIIHKRIIQNIYEYPIIICDVSAKNPNVMFELGMRLAFDKPTIVIKDDATDYPFDTSPLEYIQYPRNLRYTKMMDFKSILSSKLLATYKKSQDDATYSSYLGHLGTFKVAKLETQEVTSTEYFMEEIRSMTLEISRLAREIKRDYIPSPIVSNSFPSIMISIPRHRADKSTVSSSEIRSIFKELNIDAVPLSTSSGRFQFTLTIPPWEDKRDISEKLMTLITAKLGVHPSMRVDRIEIVNPENIA